MRSVKKQAASWWAATTQFGDFRPRKHLLISCQAEKLLFLEGRCLFNASNGNTKDCCGVCETSLGAGAKQVGGLTAARETRLENK